MATQQQREVVQAPMQPFLPGMDFHFLQPTGPGFTQVDCRDCGSPMNWWVDKVKFPRARGTCSSCALSTQAWWLTLPTGWWLRVNPAFVPANFQNSHSK